jgi:2-dehydro-3-deoxygalactonokinase
MSGMVGSASGWQEVDYLDASVPLEQLPQHLAAVTDPAWAGRCHIVPGYVYRNGAAADVMRGEETQLLGAVALGHRDGWLVLPGTHSKWVLLRDGVIQSFATYMTGELFAMLSKGGTLSAMMDGDAAMPRACHRPESGGAQRAAVERCSACARAWCRARRRPAGGGHRQRPADRRRVCRRARAPGRALP